MPARGFQQLQLKEEAIIFRSAVYTNMRVKLWAEEILGGRGRTNMKVNLGELDMQYY